MEQLRLGFMANMFRRLACLRGIIRFSNGGMFVYLKVLDLLSIGNCIAMLYSTSKSPRKYDPSPHGFTPHHDHASLITVSDLLSLA